jgi:hypothetical protein
MAGRRRRGGRRRREDRRRRRRCRPGARAIRVRSGAGGGARTGVGSWRAGRRGGGEGAGPDDEGGHQSHGCGQRKAGRRTRRPVPTPQPRVSHAGLPSWHVSQTGYPGRSGDSPSRSARAAGPSRAAAPEEGPRLRDAARSAAASRSPASVHRWARQRCCRLRWPGSQIRANPGSTRGPVRTSSTRRSATPSSGPSRAAR